MANDGFLRFGWGSRFTALCAITSTLAGCAFTETSTSVRSLPGTSTAQLRLARADTSPILGTFRQEGHVIIGQLALTNACSIESTQLTRQQEVTDTHTKVGSSVAWVVTGAVIAAVGTGLLVASADADKHVFCGDGSGQPREGEQCHSVSGAMQELGITTLVTGLIPVVAGGYFLAQKPRVETKDLATKEVKRVSGPTVCGSTASLQGLTLAVELPGNGRWLGQALADGSVRIDINPNIPLPERATLRVVVDAVPANLAGLVSPGAALGELTLRPAIKPSKASARPKPSDQRSARNAPLY